MTFLLAATGALIVTGVVIGLALGRLMRPRSTRLRLLAHLVLVAFSVVPIAVHVRYTVQMAASFGEPAIDPIGMTPELQRMMIITFSLLGAIFAVGAVISRVAPVFSAMVPAAAFMAYYLFVLPGMSDLPVLVPIDTTPVAWLFGFEALFTVLLAAYAISGGGATERGASSRASESAHH